MSFISSLRKSASRHRTDRMRREASSRFTHRSFEMEALEQRVLLAVFGGDVFYSLFTNQLDEVVNSDPSAINSNFTFTGRDGVPHANVVNVKKVTYSFNDATGELTLGAPQNVVQLDGADGLVLGPGNTDLFVGGAINNDLHKIRISDNMLTTVAVPTVDAFHITLDPTGTKIWTTEQPNQTIAEIGGSPFGTSSAAHAITGDPVTQIVFAKGHAYYTSSERDGEGFFGIIDLESFTTTRVALTGNANDMLGFAHSIVYDTFTGDLLLFGDSMVGQIDISNPEAPTLKSQLDLGPTLAPVQQNLVIDGTVPNIFTPDPNDTLPVSDFDIGIPLGVLDQGQIDGEGHAIVAVNTGHVVFLDFRATGLVEDAVVATEVGSNDLPFLERDLDDFAPVLAPATITGKVYGDTDGNGAQNGAETGAAGVTVYLDADDDNVLDPSEVRVVTDGSGNYAFTGLSPGTYVVREVVPAGTTQTEPGLPNLRYTVVVGAGDTSANNDFGNRPKPAGGTASISDFVWLDARNNNVQDAEEHGLRNFTINLFLSTDLVNPIDSTTSDSDGFYAFTDLAAGNYVVEFVAPSNRYAFVTKDSGGNDAVDSDVNPGTGRTDVIALANGENKTNVDAGVVATGIIVHIDYSEDPQGFFNDESRRDLLQLIADDLVGHFMDTFGAIDEQAFPGGTWTARLSQGPGTGTLFEAPDLLVGANELYVYAGARALGGALGKGGPGGAQKGHANAQLSQPWFDQVDGRGEPGAVDTPETDFANWGGGISFDPAANWHFGESIVGLADDENDFYSVAYHEFIHLLGFGTADSFDAQVTPMPPAAGPYFFTGPTATTELSVAQVPLAGDAAHFDFDTMSVTLTGQAQETGMDPDLLEGTRKRLTRGDLAVLNDIGWEVDLFSAQPTPTVEIFALDADAAEEGQDTGTFRVTRTGATTDPLNVMLTLGASTATNVADFTGLANLNVTIPGGAAFLDIVITPVDDGDVEGSETVVAGFQAQAQYVIGASNEATITIADNDVAGPPTVSITAPDDSATEGGDTAEFLFTRTGSTAGALTVFFTPSGNTLNGVDHTGTGVSINIPDGSATASLVITAFDDNEFDPDEQLTLTLNDNAAYTVGAPDSATIDIVNTDAPAMIGGIVFLDSDNPNGTQEPLEPGIEGLVVTLRQDTEQNGSFETLIDEQTTDADGHYNFTNLNSGLYQVEVNPAQTPIQGLIAIRANPQSLNIVAGQVVSDINFSFDDGIPTVSIAADDTEASEPDNPGLFRVFSDIAVAQDLVVNLSRNNEATPDVDYDDFPLTVTILQGETEAFIDVTPIDDDLFELTEIIFLTVEPGNGYIVGASNTDAVSILDDDSADNSSISGTKFNDLDGDGVRDAGEPGVPGVTIFLDDNNNGTLDQGEVSTVTDANGDYTFSNLAPGVYMVAEVVPFGAVQTSPEYNALITADQEVPATSSSGNGFAYLALNEATNELFFDLDFTGLSGGTTMLHIHRGVVGVDGPVLYDLEAIAGLSDGFTGPVSGVIDLAADLQFGTTVQDVINDLNAGNLYFNLHTTVEGGGEIRGQIQPRSSHRIQLNANQDVTDRDFGNLFFTGRLRGNVFEDSNRNGGIDVNEARFENVTVALFVDTDLSGALSAGDQLIDTQTTDAFGLYDFMGLPAGTYFIDVTDTNNVLAGLEATTPDPETVALPDGGDITRHFGFASPLLGSIGDFVFDDLDEDGILDAGEPGVAGVVVDLLDPLGNVLDTTVTGVNGVYVFNNVAAGLYRVRFNAPAGRAFTLQDQGGDENLDSDADPVTGETDLINLIAGENRVEVDAGLVTVSTVEVIRLGKDGGRSTKEIVTDDLGNSFELSFPGAGTLIVLKDAEGRLSLRVEGSDGKSSLTIKSKTGDGTIDSIEIMGDVKSVVAKAVHFLGNIKVVGKIASFVGGNVADQHLIEFGGAPTDKPMKAVFDNLVNVTMTSGAPIDLTVLSWSDDDQDVNPDSLTAPSAKKITVKGDKKNNIAALWEADVILTGEGSPKQTLAGFTAETVREAAFDITGDVGGFTIKGDVSDASFTVHSVMKKFSASGALTNVTMEYDEFGSIAAASWHTGELNAAFGKSLDIKGNKKANDAGDLVDVDILLTGITPGAKAKETISKIKVAGSATNLFLNVQDDPAGTIEVKNATVEGNITLADSVKALKLGNVSDSSIAAGSTGSIDVIRLTGGDINITDVKTIKTKGDKKANVDGAFTPASIVINQAGTSTAKNAVGSASIKGPLGGAWEVTGVTGATKDSAAGKISADDFAAGFTALFAGDVGGIDSKAGLTGNITANIITKLAAKTNATDLTLTLLQPEVAGNDKVQALGSYDVKGTSERVIVHSMGNIGSFKTSVIIDSEVFAGVADGETGLLTSADQLEADALIGVIDIKGGKNDPFAIIASNFAAARFGKATFGPADNDNGGVLFGAAMTTFDAITLIDEEGGKEVLKSPADVANLTFDGDARIVLLT